MYQLIRSMLFFFPAEGVHHFSMNFLRWICKSAIIRRGMVKRFSPGTGTLQREIWGLTFRNYVGLGAGFDKNALYLDVLDALGFGFVEIGTVTPLPQPGNSQPRLFRLPLDKGLINRMGFNNDGASIISDRVWRWRKNQDGNPPEKHSSQMIIGGNIGKNKGTPNEDAWKDYEICFLALFEEVDYFVVNVSSPNTPGLRALQEKDALRKILSHLQMLNLQKTKQKPILLKIAPDLVQSQLDDVIDLALEIHLDGLVVANTTISREGLKTKKSVVDEIGAGGLSGLPLQEKSTEILRYIVQQTKGTIPVIASGGIFTNADAREKLAKGASLLQVWTGFIYEGPAIVQKICRQ